MNLMNQTPIFTPASLLTCYNSALKVAVEAYPITVQGIYRPDRMNKLYGGVFYDRLIQESGKEELVIKVRPAQREQLSGKAEKLITIYGFVNRKVRPDSVIGVSLDLESVLNVEESKVSEDEKQFWNLQREKAQSGKKDVSLLFKNRLFSNEKPRVALLWATILMYTDRVQQRGWKCRTEHRICTAGHYFRKYCPNCPDTQRGGREI